MAGYDMDVEEARRFVSFLKKQNLPVATKDDLLLSYSIFRAQIKPSTCPYSPHYLLLALKSIHAIESWKGKDIMWVCESTLQHPCHSQFDRTDQLDSEEEIVWNGKDDVISQPLTPLSVWSSDLKGSEFEASDYIEDRVVLQVSEGIRPSLSARSSNDVDQYVALQNLLQTSKFKEAGGAIRKNQATVSDASPNLEHGQREKPFRLPRSGHQKHVRKDDAYHMNRKEDNRNKSLVCNGINVKYAVVNKEGFGGSVSMPATLNVRPGSRARNNRKIWSNDMKSSRVTSVNISGRRDQKQFPGSSEEHSLHKSEAFPMFQNSVSEHLPSEVHSQFLSHGFHKMAVSDGSRSRTQNKKEGKVPKGWKATQEMEENLVVSQPFPSSDKESQTVEVGKSEVSIVSVLNNGCKAVKLFAVKLLFAKPRGSFALMLEAPSNIPTQSMGVLRQSMLQSSNPLQLLGPFNLPPGACFSIQLSCTPKDIGYNKAVILFDFGDQKVVRYATLMAEDDITRALVSFEPYTGYRRPKTKRFCRIVWGTPPPAPKFLKPLGQYPIPPNIKRMLMKDHTLPIFSRGLSFETYEEYFSSLLYAEELQWKVDISAYDMQNVTMQLDRSGSFILRVPGLLERRPSIIYRDAIHVRPLGYKQEYQGFVYNIQAEEVFLKFHKSFHQSFISNQRFDVSFSYSRTTLRRALHALNASKGLERSFLFPHADTPGTISIPPYSFIPINRVLNEEQKTSVQEILRRSGGSPYLIYGPPGTGKTVTIVEAILQVLKYKPDAKILACAPSNAASDILLERLKGYIQVMDMLRLNAYTRPLDDVAPELWPYCDCEGSFFACPSLQRLSKYKVIVSTYWSAGSLEAQNLARGHFTHIFLDECGQGMEPEALVPLANFVDPKTVVVLAGDYCQLGPVIRSPLAQKFGLEKSLLERLSSLPLYSRSLDKRTNSFQFNQTVVTKLVRNYRSHPVILDLPSRLFYDGELIACAPQEICSSLCGWEELPNKSFPMLFVGIEGRDEREGKSPSWFNAQEASKVIEIVRKLKDCRSARLSDNDIGIITPYSQQVKKIKAALTSKHLQGIKAGSVEQFQGQEKRVIIISTVRSSKEFIETDALQKIAFLGNPKRFNVAITRAKALLVIVGNPYILCQDRHWGELLQYCILHKSYVGCPPPSDTMVHIQNFRKCTDKLISPGEVEFDVPSTDNFESPWPDATC